MKSRQTEATWRQAWKNAIILLEEKKIKHKEISRKIWLRNFQQTRHTAYCHCGRKLKNAGWWNRLRKKVVSFVDDYRSAHHMLRDFMLISFPKQFTRLDEWRVKYFFPILFNSLLDSNNRVIHHPKNLHSIKLHVVSYFFFTSYCIKKLHQWISTSNIALHDDKFQSFETLVRAVLNRHERMHQKIKFRHSNVT